jgi:hypothetical protein
VQTVRAIWGRGLNLVNGHPAAAALVSCSDRSMVTLGLMPYPVVVLLGSIYGR